MSSHQEEILTKIFLSVQAATGAGAIMTTIASFENMILGAISIFAGFLVIMVNWDKGVSRFKRFFKK